MWSSLASMEGLEVAAREHYDFSYRDRTIRINTESAGRGAFRYVFNHPTAWDDANNRPARIRRTTKVDIETEGRKAIDELLGNQVQLPRQSFDLLTARSDRLGQIEFQLSSVGLSLESAIASLSRLRFGSSQQYNNPVASPGAASTDVGETNKDNDPEAVATPPPTSMASHHPKDLGTATAANDNPKPTAPKKKKDDGSSPRAVDSKTYPERRKRESRIVWPPKADLLEMLWTKRGTQIARELICRPETVFAKADELDLPRPESDHWLRHKYGDAIEIPEHIKALISELRQALPNGNGRSGTF